MSNSNSSQSAVCPQAQALKAQLNQALGDVLRMRRRNISVDAQFRRIMVKHEQHVRTCETCRAAQQ